MATQTQLTMLSSFLWNYGRTWKTGTTLLIFTTKLWPLTRTSKTRCSFQRTSFKIQPTFQKVIQPCLEYAEHILNLAKTSASGDPYGIAQLRKLRASQLKRMHRLQGRWEDLLQTARDFDESVTFRRLSEIMESTKDEADEEWLNAKQLMDSYAEDNTRQIPHTSLHVMGVPASLQSTPTTLQPEHKTILGESQCIMRPYNGHMGNHSTSW